MESGNPVLQALHQGIQTELQGRTFYRKAAERSRDPKGQEVFRSLMRDEEMHLRLLQVQYGALVDEGRWLEMEQARELEPGRAAAILFPQEDEALAALLPAEGDDLRALQLALDFEHRGYQMYRRRAGETDDPAGRALYDFLAAQEQKHYDFIHRALEYLQTQGAWFYDERELPFFEG
ncbi:MAG: ferritin family protein [Chloroflexia bacterium]